MTAEIHIAGRSKHLEHLRKQVARLAANRKDVLVVGEPGVGKSMVASLIVAGDAVRVFDLASKNEEELHAELDSISHGAVVFEGIEDAGYRTQDEVPLRVDQGVSGATQAG
ncbi:MAG: Sigma-54 factor interaction protein [Bacteroidetes bacterium]|nr:Sigma-54 factor interaction protein [Bacteroidota bacterium]